MAASRVEPGFDQDRNFIVRDASHGLAPDLSRVLIVGKSQINRIVVAKIVERSGPRGSFHFDPSAGIVTRP